MEARHTARDVQRRLETLSPFELKAKLLELADARGADMLMNAVRGDPNWSATTPRAAFRLLRRFGLEEADRVWSEPGVGGMPERAGIASRLRGFLAHHADDPSVKVFFLVNPSNPPSVAVRQRTLDRIAEIVRTRNPDLIVISDDVSGTFVPGFRSFLAGVPHNAIGVYSFDRMVADSRSVALNHTAGLSLPQQVQMTVFALFSLLDSAEAHKSRMQEVVRHRLDLLLWAEHRHGAEFAGWGEESFEPVDVVFRLAEQESVVLLNGGGFAGPPWSIRVSLANLPDETYRRIGEAISRIGAEYVSEYEAATGQRV